jgi:hypothetical protein
MRKQNGKQPTEFAKQGLKALRRAARNAHRIAAAYGTPVYIEKNCIDRTDREQVFGDIVNTFKVIPVDRKESEVCPGESVLPCLNVTSS